MTGKRKIAIVLHGEIEIGWATSEPRFVNLVWEEILPILVEFDAGQLSDDEREESIREVLAKAIELDRNCAGIKVT